MTARATSSRSASITGEGAPPAPASERRPTARGAGGPAAAREAGSCPECERLGRENARLAGRVRELEGRVEELRRAAKRQAAPFSRDAPAATPGRPGRRAGEGYGTRARREPPARVDEVVPVALPEGCPSCGGEIARERVAVQYQEELAEVVPRVCRYEIEVGRCLSCRKRVQPRHPAQSSDALGAAAAQIGPRALAIAATLNKELGLPVAKVARVLKILGGLTLTPGGLHQALHRQARALAPTGAAIEQAVRQSPAVACDETGWRVAGRRRWLWTFVGAGATSYRIAMGRGYDQAKEVLGAGFAGVIERDGWAPYRRFTTARHQSCLAHLLRRTHEMIADADRGQARVPHALRRILTDALAVRDRRDAGAIGDAECARARDALAARIDTLCAGRPTHPPNKRLLAHLRNERHHLLTFLHQTGVQATNWRAEQALRPAVVARKAWGGNRSARGAHTQQVLMSVCRTCRQQGLDPVAVLAGRLRQRAPGVAPELRLPGRDPPAAR